MHCLKAMHLLLHWIIKPPGPIDHLYCASTLHFILATMMWSKNHFGILTAKNYFLHSSSCSTLCKVKWLFVLSHGRANFLSMSLGWPHDLLCPRQCDRNSIMPILSLDFKRPGAFSLTLLYNATSVKASLDYAQGGCKITWRRTKFPWSHYFRSVWSACLLSSRAQLNLVELFTKLHFSTDIYE